MAVASFLSVPQPGPSAEVAEEVDGALLVWEVSTIRRAVAFRQPVTAGAHQGTSPRWVAVALPPHHRQHRSYPLASALADHAKRFNGLDPSAAPRWRPQRQ